QHRGAQLVVGMVVGAAHALVDGVLQRTGETFPAHVHAHFQEHGDDAGVLADRAVALGAHARVDQGLRHRVPGRRRFLALIRRRQAADVVDRVVVADVLEGVGDRLDQVVLLDRAWSGVGHGWLAAGGETPILAARRVLPPVAPGPGADRSVPLAGPVRGDAQRRDSGFAAGRGRGPAAHHEAE